MEAYIILTPQNKFVKINKLQQLAKRAKSYNTK